MKLIRTRILQVQAKINMVSDAKTYSNEDRQKLENLYKETTEPGTILTRINEVQDKLELYLDRRHNFVPTAPSEAFEQLSNEEKRRVITVLKEQTKGIFDLTKTIKRTAFKLEVIEKVNDEINAEKERAAVFNHGYRKF